jgi:hypothetical protein
MKYLFLSLALIVIVTSLHSQNVSDTLVIGKYRFPLTRTKAHYDAYQPGVVNLPSEYTDVKNEVRIPYKFFSDSISVFEVDKDGNQYWVLKPEKRVQEPDAYTYLPYFLDTVKLKAEDLQYLKPYIKQKTGKVYFTAIRLLNQVDTTITEYLSGSIYKGELFSVLGVIYGDFKKLKNSSILITDSYYRKGNATYYFNRNLIILLN